MGGLTFLGLSERVLEEEKRPLSPFEISKIAQQELRTRTEIEGRKNGKTPASTLYSAIMTDGYFEKSRFIKVSKRPARYFLKRPAPVRRVGID
ncbi:HTH domain-containing protein [Bradyrhizobium sp. LA2.1]|uniref:HTH domain-containing protein n=1 Tax=Bradyrhizobium sp. LA2.1 TaxID=3156376 RepID=UPI00339A783B